MNDPVLMLSHSEVAVLSLIKSGLIQTNPVVYRLMTNERLLRYQAWNVVNSLISKGLIEKEYTQKKKGGRLTRVQTLVLTDSGKKMFGST